MWTTSGLLARPLPPMFRLAQEQTEGWESYEILGTQFHAAVQRIERAAGFPQVRLADVRVFWTGAERYVGTVAFDIEPAGTTHGVVRTAENMQILGTFVDGVPVFPEQVAPDQWRLPLGPPQLPQRLEFVYRSRFSQPVGRRPLHFESPWIEDLPVAETLFTIRVPWREAAWLAAAPEYPTTDARQELARLGASAAMVDSAFNLAAEGGATEAEDWIRLWIARISQSRRTLEHRDPHAADARLIGEKMSVIDNMWSGLTQKLGSATVGLLQDNDLTDYRSTFLPWEFATQHASRDQYSMIRGRAEMFTLTPPPAAGDVWWRVAAALGVIGAGGLLFVLIRRGTRVDILVEYPQAILALVGLMWVMWLAPAVVGWGLVVVAVLAAMRSPWRRPRIA
jgi:hypothetical protein